MMEHQADYITGGSGIDIAPSRYRRPQVTIWQYGRFDWHATVESHAGEWVAFTRWGVMRKVNRWRRAEARKAATRRVLS